MVSSAALFFFFSSRRRHTRSLRDWSSDVCSSDLVRLASHIERDFVAIEPYRAAALALHQPAGQLPGNLPLALAEHVVDRRSEERRVGKECRSRWSREQ